MDNHFDGAVAATYAAASAAMFEPDAIDPALDVLAGLAGGGRALEFAIGTGRIALPLAARGIPVSGIDLSAAMVAQLRDKPGGAEIDVLIGDLATTRVAGDFALVYLNLEPGGCFVVEVGVPGLRLLPPGQTAVPFRTGEEGWAYDLYDRATQAMSSNYVDVQDGEARLWSIPFRYVWPAELDLMARIAGMRLRDRWQDWHGTPFTHESRSHVSVWQLPAS